MFQIIIGHYVLKKMFTNKYLQKILESASIQLAYNFANVVYLKVIVLLVVLLQHPSLTH